MPSKSDHLALAERNQCAIEHLQTGEDGFPDWVATVAFYKALHLAEAVLATRGVHSHDHGCRERTLKCDHTLQKIWRHFRPLQAASVVARYLSGGKNTFSAYMSADEVRTTLLGHHLHQVEKTAQKLLQPKRRKPRKK